MDSALYEMIYKRKSFHLFRGTGNLSLGEEEIVGITEAYRQFSPLYPEIRTEIKIVPGRMTSCRREEEYCILLFSEQKDGYLQNIGYLGEQLDLYLVSRGIGTLWFGIGRPEEVPAEDLPFIIMIAVRKIDDAAKFRKDMFRSKRKPAAEIWQGDAVQGVTDIVRFAPSACNTQPWLVINDGDLSVYRYRKPGKRGIMPADKVTYYNRIDIGIFLCFTELCLSHEGISFQRELHIDEGGDEELTLNAVYRLENTCFRG